VSQELALETVKTLLRTLFDVSEDEVRLGAHLADDLDLDSLDAVELLHGLEDETGVSVEEQELQSLRTVADLVRIVSERASRAAS
jgi:acyl carrier protein